MKLSSSNRTTLKQMIAIGKDHDILLQNMKQSISLQRQTLCKRDEMAQACKQIDHVCVADCKIAHSNINKTIEDLKNNAYPGYNISYDNIDIRRERRHMSMAVQNLDIHWVPLGVIFKNENINNEMIDILKKFQGYMPHNTNAKEEKTFEPQLLSGDQLSVERAINVIHSVSNGYNETDRLEGMIVQIGDWHTCVKILELSQIISNPQRVQTLTIERNTANQPPPLEINQPTKPDTIKSPITRSPVGRHPSLDLIGSPNYDQKFKRHHMPWEEDTFENEDSNSTDRKTRKKPERANSLPRRQRFWQQKLRRKSSIPHEQTNCQGNSTDNNNVMKCNSPLHRSQSMKAEAGQVFRPSDLIVGEVIGKGFFGQVSKVVHRGTGKVMVLKELIRCDVTAQKQFIKEVTLLKTLEHPNVLKFIGILYKNKVLSFIAEYITGGTLRGILKDQSRDLSWSQRVKFAKDIALGMDYLHKMNVIHRDLKSKNCLARKDEGMTIVVADFGLAGIMSINEEQTNGRDQNNNGNKHSNLLSARPPPPKKRTTVVGSPYWMAPEMLNGNAYDERVDIFSFGIIVCEIISRVKANPDFIPRTKAFGLDEPSFEGKFCESCPKSFFQIACLCCDLDPSARPTFSSLSHWLEALLVHLEVGMPLPSDVAYSLLPKSLKTSVVIDAKETGLAR